MLLWDRIQKKLNEKNRTIYWLSKQTGISESMLYALRNEVAKDIGFTKVEKIADVLEVNINEFREEKKK